MGMTDAELHAKEDAELRRMKTEVHMPHFLTQREGWAPKTGEGTGGPTFWALERDNVTINVSLQKDDHGDRNWVFHEAHQVGPGCDRGSIIDYMIQFRGARSIGHARGIVRRMMGWSDPRRRDLAGATLVSAALSSHPHRAAEPEIALAGTWECPSEPTVADAAEVEMWRTTDALWRRLAPLTAFDYMRLRGLHDDLVRANSYLIRQVRDTDLPPDIRPDLRFTNPAFGYEVQDLDNDAPIVAGFDRRYFQPGTNKSKKLMLGRKCGLWLSRCEATAGGFATIIIGESPITVLSFLQLFQHQFPNSLLVAFGGRMQRNQLPRIVDLCSRLPDSAVIVAADADRAGAKFIADIKKHVERAVGIPPFGNGKAKDYDWNDVLREEMDE